MTERKIGKLPARHDPRTFKLAAPLAARLPVIPSKVNWAPITLTGDQVLKNYADESGFAPATGANDNGAVELDVLNRWRCEGYAMPGSQPGRSFLTAFGSVNPQSNQQVQRAIAFLGGLYIGLSLPNYAVEGDGDWTINNMADNTIAGGHAV